MKTPEQSAKAGSTIRAVFMVFLLGGVAMAAAPSVVGAGGSNGIGLSVLGGFLALLGLVGASVMGGRGKTMQLLLKGDGILDRWEDRERGTILLSHHGFFCEGELYTMKGYACSVAKAAMDGGVLEVQYLTARKTGQRRHTTRIPVPTGHEEGARRFIEAVTAANA